MKKPDVARPRSTGIDDLLDEAKAQTRNTNA